MPRATGLSREALLAFKNYRALYLRSSTSVSRSSFSEILYGRARSRGIGTCGKRRIFYASDTQSPKPVGLIFTLQRPPTRFRRPEKSFDSISTFSTRPFHIGSARGFHTTTHPHRWTSKIGAEPGVDSAHSSHSSESADHHHYPSAESEIRIIDYSDKQIIQHEPTKDSLESFLQSNEKPDWAACRWIYVNGLDWRTVSCLARRKGLHRLALEDVLDTSTPTKVDCMCLSN